MVCKFFDKKLAGGSIIRAAKLKERRADKSAIITNQQLANDLLIIKNFKKVNYILPLKTKFWL